MVAKVTMLILKNKICGIIKNLKTRTIVIDYIEIKPGFGWEVKVY